MNTFDNYIFDSQFTFLKEQVKLQEAYNQLVSKNATEIAGLKTYIRSESWDSEKFKKNIGRLLWLEDRVSSSGTCYNIIEKLKVFDCCYIRLNSKHSFWKYAKQNTIVYQSAKASQHIHLKEREFTFDPAMPVTEYGEQLSNKEEIITQVLKLSEGSFLHNRFRTDPHFSDEQINGMYREWISNEIKEKTSTLYLIIEKKEVASFFLYKENISPLPQYKIGFVSLIASSPEFKGKNYATGLLNAVLGKAKEHKTDYVIANTEKNNDKAIHFFRKNNFTVTSHLNEYHIWS
jgi:ribosomal protein S18 acetylase RimI-like enzyme